MNRNTRAKFREYERSNSNYTFLYGILAGGIAGAAAALLLAPKTGKQIRKKIKDTYDDISEKIEDTKDSLVDQGEDLIETAQGWMSGSDTKSNIIIGGITGGLFLGAVAAFILAYKSQGRDAYEAFVEKAQEFAKHLKSHSEVIPQEFRNKAEKWLHKANCVLNSLEKALKNGHESHAYDDIEEEVEGHSPVNQFLDLADLGMRIFHTLKHRR